VFRRLERAQVDGVVEAYTRGATLREVAQQFRVHRTTVSELLERRGVQRRYAALRPEQVFEAEELYKAGRSLVAIGNVLKVNQSTVWHALRGKGVPLRRPWERGS
jgi:transposase